MAFQIPEDRRTPITNPEFVKGMAATLLASEEEFPIRVEGTSTLPYSSQVKEVNPEKGWWVLKLQRALPPELVKGAIFRCTTTFEGQRFEGLTQLMGRDSYLHYKFLLPKEVVLADRRAHKRYPFRPRENAMVYLTDGKKAVSGPLSSLGARGFGFRADRIVHLESHGRLPLDTIHFVRGAGWVVRIQDMPKVGFLEASGKIAYANATAGGLMVGLEFAALSQATRAALETVLKIREIALHGVHPPGEAKEGASAGASKGPGPREKESEKEKEAAAPPQPLLRLRRRAVPLALLMQEGEPRNRMKRALAAEGYWRVVVGHDPSVLQASGRMVVGLEADCAGLEGSLPMEPGENAGSLARRLDAVMGLRE